MFFPIALHRVCLVASRVDFRKGHDGLLGEAYRLGLSPYHGDLVIFVGRRRDSLKLLAADSTGLWLWYKKFHEGTIAREFRFLTDPAVSFIAPSTVNRLLEGTKFQIAASPAPTSHPPPSTPTSFSPVTLESR